MQLARTCLTTAAADVWAVGALAFELSTGGRLPCMCMSGGRVWPQMTPWASLMRPGTKSTSGILRYYCCCAWFMCNVDVTSYCAVMCR